MSIGMIACSNEVKKNEIDNLEEDKIKVYATIYPIYDFAKNIGGDKIDLNYIVPPSGEPHDYEISAKMLKDIQNADLLIMNGLGIDGFADNIKAEKNNLNIVVASDGVSKLKYNEELHNDVSVKNEDEHEHGQYDPHVWLNIDNAIKECENIKDALIKADEENKEFYENNFNEYTSKLSEIQENYKKELSNLKNNIILVSHDAYGYLCNEYNLNQISVTGVSPNQEPSMNKIAQISKFAKENNIKYILFDGLVNSRVSQTIADEASINTLTLYSIDGINKDDLKNNQNYISLMEKNLETLKTVLK
ncbi:MAG: metal ABC transporter solute-binding protein, Zn/Mn family, partial [Peptostreptococcaceae bacterium]